MKEDYTHITFLLDRSGSMSNVWSDVKGGFKTLIEDQKKEAGECTFTLVTFDHDYETPVNFQNIKDVSGELTVNPRGNTALLDSLGKAIVETGERLAKMDEKDRPSKILFISQTDGQENASKEFSRGKIKDLIKQQEDKYKWKFMFLGADQNAIQQAASFGFAANMVSTYGGADSMTKGIGAKMSQVRSMTHDMYVCSGAGAFTQLEREELNK